MPVTLPQPLTHVFTPSTVPRDLDAIEPVYEALLEMPVDDEPSVKAFLAAWDETSCWVSDHISKSRVAAHAHTDDEEAAKVWTQVVQGVLPALSAYDEKLGRKLLHLQLAEPHPWLEMLEPNADHLDRRLVGERGARTGEAPAPPDQPGGDGHQRIERRPNGPEDRVRRVATGVFAPAVDLHRPVLAVAAGRFGGEHLTDPGAARDVDHAQHRSWVERVAHSRDLGSRPAGTAVGKLAAIR